MDSDVRLETPAGDAPALDWLKSFGNDDFEAPASQPPVVRTETPPAVPSAEPAAPAAAPVATTPAATPVKTDEPFAEPKPAAAAPAVTTPPATPAAPVTPETPAKPAEQPPAVKALETQWQKTRETAIADLKKVYAFSEEDRQAIGEELADKLTDMAAKAHVNVYESVMNGLYTVMPDIIRDVLAFDSAKARFDTAFFAKWKALEPFKADVDRAVKLYTAFNPGAKTEQIVNEVGLQLMIGKKLPIPGVTGTDPATPPTDAPAFTPAIPGAGGEAVEVKTADGGKYSQFLADEE